MKIAVFGASVSHQANAHATGEPRGYSEFLRREHQLSLGAAEIMQICYPGSRIADGGMARVFDVVAYRPDICIMEMIVEDMSRGLTATEEDYMFAIDQVVACGALPLFFIPPWPRANADMKAARLMRGVAEATGFPIVEIDLPEDADPKVLFDGVHTLGPGGQLYAEHISRAIKGLGDIRTVQQAASSRWSARRNPTRNVSILSWSRDTFCVAELRVGAQHPTNIRIIQQQMIGPTAPLFLSKVISPDGEVLSEKAMSAWDPYCHYDRASFVLLGEHDIPEGASTVRIEKIPAAPDYALCRRAIPNPPEVDQLIFRPIGDMFIVADARIDVGI